MSKRPTEHKRRRKVAKAFRRAPLPAFIDPIEWLMQHGYAKNKRDAREIVLAGRLKSESHTVGVADGLVESSKNPLIGSVLKPGKVVAMVPADYRKTLRVQNEVA